MLPVSMFVRVFVCVCVSDIEEELCDGNPVLINPRTGLEYNCNPGRDTCPAGSYCHKLVNVARCCQQGLYECLNQTSSLLQYSARAVTLVISDTLIVHFTYLLTLINRSQLLAINDVFFSVTITIL